MDRYSLAPLILDSNKKRRIQGTLIFPNTTKNANDIYIITSIGDRLDSIAEIYYNNVTLWWVIAFANPDIEIDSLYLEPGTQLRIPSVDSLNIDLLKNTIKSLNTNR